MKKGIFFLSVVFAFASTGLAQTQGANKEVVSAKQLISLPKEKVKPADEQKIKAEQLKQKEAIRKKRVALTPKEE